MSVVVKLGARLTPARLAAVALALVHRREVAAAVSARLGRATRADQLGNHERRCLVAQHAEPQLGERLSLELPDALTRDAEATRDLRVVERCGVGGV